MKRHFVIEADTEMYSVFVREVTQSFHKDEVRYSHRPEAPIPVMEVLGPSFNAQLNALLVTKGTLENAEPMEEDQCATQNSR